MDTKKHPVYKNNKCGASMVVWQAHLLPAVIAPHTGSSSSLVSSISDPAPFLRPEKAAEGSPDHLGPCTHMNNPERPPDFSDFGLTQLWPLQQFGRINKQTEGQSLSLLSAHLSFK